MAGGWALHVPALVQRCTGREVPAAGVVLSSYRRVHLLALPMPKQTCRPRVPAPLHAGALGAQPAGGRRLGGSRAHHTPGWVGGQGLRGSSGEATCRWSWCGCSNVGAYMLVQFGRSPLPCPCTAVGTTVYARVIVGLAEGQQSSLDARPAGAPSPHTAPAASAAARACIILMPFCTLRSCPSVCLRAQPADRVRLCRPPHTRCSLPGHPVQQPHLHQPPPGGLAAAGVARV